MTETQILRELLAAEPGWVSGGALAEKLGVSRVSIWNQMEKLRAQGFAFEAVSARGYRLAGRPHTLHAGLIEAQLKLRRKGFSFSVMDEVDSTNDEAARQLASGKPAPFAILAKRQTKGRGRFGRVWHSEAGGNLYVSFAFRPQIEPGRMQTFTLWMGVTVCELVSKFVPSTLGVKWPNDLVFEGRKAGGMLTEARVDADQIRDLVFGLGINVNSQPSARPADLAARSISLCELTESPVDLNRLTAALIGRVVLAYERFLDNEHTEEFTRLWAKYDTLKGREVTVLEAGRPVRGSVLGIDDAGSLLLRTADGRTRGFRAGEVTLSKEN